MSKVKARQADMDLGTEPFALAVESALDGDRIASERSKAAERQAEFDAAQMDLVPVNQNCRCFRPLASELFGHSQRCRDCGQLENQHPA